MRAIVKVFIPLVALVAMSSSTLSAQYEVSFHQWRLYSGSDKVDQTFLKGFAMLPSSNFYVWGNAYRESGYWSGVLGPGYAPTEWLSFGVAFGTEVFNGTRFRYAGNVFLSYADKCSAEFCYEDGPSVDDWWSEVDAQCHPFNWMTLGALYQRGAGIGPQLALQPFSELPFQVFMAPLWNEGQTNFLGGIQLVISK